MTFRGVVSEYQSVPFTNRGPQGTPVCEGDYVTPYLEGRKLRFKSSGNLPSRSAQYVADMGLSPLPVGLEQCPHTPTPSTSLVQQPRRPERPMRGQGQSLLPCRKGVVRLDWLSPQDLYRQQVEPGGGVAEPLSLGHVWLRSQRHDTGKGRKGHGTRCGWWSEALKVVPFIKIVWAPLKPGTVSPQTPLGNSSD